MRSSCAAPAAQRLLVSHKRQYIVFYAMAILNYRASYGQQARVARSVTSSLHDVAPVDLRVKRRLHEYR